MLPLHRSALGVATHGRLPAAACLPLRPTACCEACLQAKTLVGKWVQVRGHANISDQRQWECGAGDQQSCNAPHCPVGPQEGWSST